MQAVKQQYPGYDVAAPIPFRFNPPEDGHSDPQNSIYIRFERYPTGEWVLAKKNAGQVCMHFSCCVLLTLILVVFIHCAHAVAGKWCCRL